MASILAAQVSNLYTETGGTRFILLRIIGVTNGDTIDVSAIGPVPFKKIQCATFIDSALNQVGTVSIAGTVLTLNLANMALDTVTLLIQGEG